MWSGVYTLTLWTPPGMCSNLGSPTETLSPWVTGALCNNPRGGWRCREEAAEVCQSSLLGEQSHKSTNQTLSVHPTPTPCSFTPGIVWLQGTALGFHRFETPSCITFSCRVGALRSRQPDHRGDAHLPREHRTASTNLQRSKNQSSAKETKNRVLQWHPLEKNRKTSSYQSIREVPLTHGCLDREEIRQMPWITEVMRQLGNKRKNL